MPSNYGRNGVWNAQIWSDIDKAVNDQVAHFSVVRQVFKPTNTTNAFVPADRFGPDKISEGTKPFIEISIDFTLAQTQVENEATLHTAQTLAKLACKSLVIRRRPASSARDQCHCV